MAKAKLTIIGVFIISILVWSIDIYLRDVTFSGRTVTREAIYITGVISFIYMGLIMLLSVRPKWLERFWGGMDKIYYLHKRAGILAIIFAGLHYFIELSKRKLELLIGQGIVVKKAQVEFTNIELYLRGFRGLAKSLGEYGVYILLAMLVLTLWKKFPYKLWRYTHKLMAPVFLAIAFHTVILAPTSYWSEPIGILLFVTIIIGSVCAFIAIFGLIGKKSTFKGKVIALKLHDDLIEITCKLSGNWSHEAGQYAFFKNNWIEGAHPFTISSADTGDNTVRFSIKELGDYTKQLKNKIKVGDNIEVEGPYGLFNYQLSQDKHQIWIGGGIGITPFIAWLEQMVKDKDMQTSVDLYYCVYNENRAPYLSYLNEICASLPNVNFHPHYSDKEGELTLSQLPIKNTSDLWFCGPSVFEQKLKKEIKKQKISNSLRFHQECFQMR